LKRSFGDRERKGCMLVNAALDVAPHDPGFRKVVAEVLAHIEAFFLTCVKAGQGDGTIARSLPAETLSHHLLGVLMVSASSRASGPNERCWKALWRLPSRCSTALMPDDVAMRRDPMRCRRDVSSLC